MSNELDDWMRTEVLPLVKQNRDELITMSAYKLLERYLQGNPVADNCTFLWAIMGHCEVLAAEFAEKVAYDQSNRLATRFEAMSLIVRCPYADKSIPSYRRVLKQLLLTSARDPDERYYKGQLIEASLANDSVWKTRKVEVRNALSELWIQWGLSTSEPLISRASCRGLFLEMRSYSVAFFSRPRNIQTEETT